MTIEAPSGELTIIFTDVEGSTALWDRVPDAMQRALEDHDELLRRLLIDFHGYEVKSDGDAFMVAFGDPARAVAWCLEVQRALLTLDWPQLLLDQPEAGIEFNSDGLPLTRGLRVRMGGHIGRPHQRQNPTSGRMDYFGGMVNRAARVSHSGHGGQIVLSRALLEKAGDSGELVQADLGTFKLSGLSEAEHLIQILPRALANRRFPALRATPFRRPQIAPPPLPLLGRAVEQEALLDALRGGHRRVFIKGPPGMGKSHLAKTVIAQFQEEALIACLELTGTDSMDPEAVIVQLATALDLPLGELLGKDGVEAQIPHALRAQGRTVILVHGWDQLNDESLALLNRWEAQADALYFVFTGTERPDPSKPLVIPIGPVDAAGAISIFVDAARRQLGSFDPSPADQQAIVQMSEELDGSPLAIRLTAGRLKELRPHEILNLLPERLPHITDHHAQSERLHLALRLSWDGLSDLEQGLIRIMAWVPAPLSMEHIQALLPKQGGLELKSVQTMVQGLDERSFLLPLRDEADEAPPRWGLLKSVRRFAQMQGQDVLEKNQALTRLLGSILPLLEPQLDGYRDHRRTEVRALLLDHLDLLVAMGRANLGDLSMRATLCALPVLRDRGDQSVLRDLLGLDRIIQIDDRDLRVRARLARFKVAMEAYDQEAAVREVETAIKLLGTSAPEEMLNWTCQTALASVYVRLKRFDEAEVILEAVLAHIGDQQIRETWTVTERLGRLKHLRGDPSSATELYHRAKAGFESIGDLFGAAALQGNLAIIAQGQQPSEAERLYRSAASRFHEAGATRSELAQMTNMARTRFIQGRFLEGQRDYEALLGRWTRLGQRIMAANCHFHLGAIALLQGRTRDALTDLAAAQQILVHAGHREWAGMTSGYLALALALDQRFDEAAETQSQCRQLLEGITRAPVQMLCTFFEVGIRIAHLETPSKASSSTGDSASDCGQRLAEIEAHFELEKPLVQLERGRSDVEFDLVHLHRFLKERLRLLKMARSL